MVGASSQYRTTVVVLGAAFIVAGSVSCSGSSDPKQSPWVAVVGTEAEDSVSCVAADASGHVYAAGLTNGTDPFLREYARDGTVLLEKSWPSASRAIPSGLAVLPSGGVVLSVGAGCTPGSTCFGPDFGAGPTQGDVLARLDSSGGLVWQLDSGAFDAQMIAPRPSYERPVVKPDGNIVVEGKEATSSFIAQLSPDGDELWRRPKGTMHGFGATVIVDGAGHATALGLSSDTTVQPSLTQYDDDGNTVWQIQPQPIMIGSIAAVGDTQIVLIDDAHRLRIYRAADGALLRVIDTNALANAFVAADASHVVVVGTSGAYNCVVPVAVSYDLTGRMLSATTLADGCTAPWVYASTIGSAGDTILGGAFNLPYDFLTGTSFAPRGWDGFVMDLPR